MILRKGLRIFALSTSILFLAASLTGCGSSSAQAGNSQKEDVIKIGFYGPLTGDDATDGIHGRQAAQLAIDEANDAGGINGKKLQLVSEDDQAKPQEALKAVEKLIQVDKVTAIIAGSYSTPVKTSAPSVQSAKTPMIVTIAVHPDITKGGKYVFRTIYTGITQGQAMANYVTGEPKLKNFAILYDESDYGTSVSAAFKDKLNSLGGKVVLERSFKSGEKDFNPLITAVKDAKPDGLYVVGYYNEAAQIVQQAKQQSLNIPIFGVDGFDSPKFLELGGTAANGVIFSTSFSSEDPRPIVQNFIKTFKEKNKNDVPDMVAAQSYDSTKILIQALKKAGTDKEALRNAIAETKNFDGVTGTTSFNANNEVDKSVVLIKVQNGKFTFLKNQ